MEREEKEDDDFKVLKENEKILNRLILYLSILSLLMMFAVLMDGL